MTFRALVLRAAGTNCDLETVAALELAGARADRVHINRLLEEPALLQDYRLLVLPGGFTFGDDVASAAVLSYTLGRRLRDSLDEFVAAGRWVLGICNGFQALVRLGYLPGRRGQPGGSGQAALLRNFSGRFVARWVRLQAGETRGPWLEPGREYFMPVAHAEGRFEWFPQDSGAPFPADQIQLTYMADNPNGSHQDIAGVTNEAGNVMGLMPHPERFAQPTHHPFWTRFRTRGAPPAEEDLPVPLGLDLFRRVVRAG